MKREASNYSAKENVFSKLENEIQEFWKEINLNDLFFNKNLNSKKKFIFYDGPPGTNGKPHIGHMIQSTLKDLYIRYKGMQGYFTLIKLGWDAHGLPIELKAQKDLNLNSKKEIQNYGIEKFIKYCKQIVFTYKDEWMRSINRLGRIINTNNTYTTSSFDYIQSVWWVLKVAWEKKLLYKDYKINAYCPRLGTSLSNQEVALGYKEVTDLSLYIKFEIIDSRFQFENSKSYFLAWTTTPWTLIGNLALTLSPNIIYIKIKILNEIYILAKNLLKTLCDLNLLSNEYEILGEILGENLKNIQYKPLWNFFHKEKNEYQKLYSTVLADFVDDKEGTGIVHIAFYGEEDFNIIKKENLPFIQHVNSDGQFIEKCEIYKNKFFDDPNINIQIEKDLTQNNFLLGKKKIKHKYPFNYKTDTRLIYYAKKSWFLKTSSFKDLMLKLNQTINWKPQHIQLGRFGNWLKNNIDWNISRERFWGTPLPIWECKNKHQICISSLSEINNYSTHTIDEDNFDAHIPNIDNITLKCPKCNELMKRETEVLDCWIDASIMPWGQFAYPHQEESKAIFENNYPCDFICEGLDQTRGWFYGLLVTSSFLTQKAAFKNVVCTDLVLDKKGNKMSKSKNNVVEPDMVFKQFGADAIRWFFIQSPIGKPMRFSDNALNDTIKIVSLPLWNIYRFLSIYALLENYSYKRSALYHFNFDVKQKFTKKIDNWILSEIENLNEKIIQDLDQYNSDLTSNKILYFIDNLSNWYIRRNRKRFWKEENDQDKQDAFDCLFIVFYKLSCLLAPFLPHLTDYFYKKLFIKLANFKEESIHLHPFPKPNMNNRNINLENSMKQIREICHLGNGLRNRLKIKIRQPLPLLKIEYQSNINNSLFEEYENLIKEELNLKKIIYKKSKVNENFNQFKIKANFKILGSKLGQKIKDLSQYLNSLNQQAILDIQKKGQLIWNFNDEKIVIYNYELLFIKDDLKHSVNQDSSENFKIELKTELTDDLIKEGLAREFIHHVQNMRKNLKLDVEENINITYFSNDSNIQFLKNSIQLFEKYIKQETLAKNIVFKKIEKNNTFILNQFKIQLAISKC